MHIQKPKAFYKLTDQEKKYYFAGIPIKFYKFETPYEFQSITVDVFDGKQVKQTDIFPTDQMESFDNLKNFDYFEDDLFIIIASNPTNYIALGLGAQLAMKAVDLKYKVSFWNAANDAKELKDDDKDVIFIYNVFSTSNIDRIQNARDVLYNKYNKFRVLLLGGDLDPVKFIQTHLHMATNVVLYTTSPTITKVFWR